MCLAYYGKKQRSREYRKIVISSASVSHFCFFLHLAGKILQKKNKIIKKNLEIWRKRFVEFNFRCGITYTSLTSPRPRMISIMCPPYDTRIMAALFFHRDTTASFQQAKLKKAIWKTSGWAKYFEKTTQIDWDSKNLDFCLKLWCMSIQWRKFIKHLKFRKRALLYIVDRKSYNWLKNVIIHSNLTMFHFLSSTIIG